MSKFNVEIASRKKNRDFKNALGTDITRYITELVTNADDSYKRLEKNSKECDDGKVIIIKLSEDKRKKGYILSVTDNAEGMSKERLETVFKTYGNDNANGVESHARGIFGQGAADVLQASAYEKRTAMIESIKDNCVSKLTYNMDDNFNSSIEVDNITFNKNGLKQYRSSHNISNNGTVVTFGIPERVKFSKRVRENLPEAISTAYSLRYILNRDDLKVYYLYENKTLTLSSKKYQFNDDNKMGEEHFSLSYKDSNLDCTLRLYKNANKDVDGTNIIVRDENYVVYDNLMFGFENSAVAEDVSGELIINGLYSLCYECLNDLKNPLAIVNDNRTGFNQKTDFYDRLNKIMYAHLSNLLKENEKSVKSTNLNNKKFSDALKKLNKYIKSEISDSITGGNLKGVQPPEEGIKFIRKNITISKDKIYSLKLLINPEIVSPEDLVTLSCDDQDIEFTPSDLTYENTDINENGVVEKNITIKGSKVKLVDAILQASCKLLKCACTISVIEDDIHYPENGLEFYPKTQNISANGKHIIKLYFDTDIIPTESSIQIKCKAMNIETEISASDNYIVKDNIGVIPVPIQEGTIDEKYQVEASFQDITTIGFFVINEKSDNNSQTGGLIAGFKLESNKNPFYQSYFNPQTHFIVINPENIINKKILGDLSGQSSNNPQFTTQQKKYLCDIIANEAAQILVKNNAKKGEINFDDYNSAIEIVQQLIQKHKNEMYKAMYPALMGEAEE